MTENDVFDQDGDAYEAYTVEVLETSTRPNDVRQAARRRKLDDAFAGRKFDIVREVHLPADQAFRTLLGNTGRHGWVIKDKNNGEQFVVTRHLLNLVVNEYKGVEEFPDTRPRLT